MKVNFGVTAMLHATGEADISDGDEQHIFIHPLQISPVLVVFSETPLSEGQLEVLRAMALHQLVKLALGKVKPAGLTVDTHSEINMNPAEGEKN